MFALDALPTGYGFEYPTAFFEAVALDLNGGITSPAQLDIGKYMLGIVPSDIGDDGVCVYLKRNGYCEIVTIKNVSGIITVPSSFEGLSVTRINTYALCGDTLTDAVIISSGISKISTLAFYDNDTLRFISIPTSVEAVNYHGFCDLSKCLLSVEAEVIPADWDNDWRAYVGGTVIGKTYGVGDEYIYELFGGKLYLVSYIGEMDLPLEITFPEKVNGISVYGIRSECFDVRVSNSDSCTSA